MVVLFLVAFSRSVPYSAVISTGTTIARLSPVPIAVCGGGVLAHFAVGALVRLFMSKCPTSTTPMTTITAVLRIQSGIC
jgi:hypothetical protein